MSAERTKQVGGFRSTLAFIMSLVALVLSFLAYTGAKDESQLTGHIEELQTKLDKMKAESAQKIDELRNETSEALNNMSKSIKVKREGKGEKDSKDNSWVPGP